MAYFEMDGSPVDLAGIVIGDGTITIVQAFNESIVVSVLETYPQIVGYDTQVFKYSQEQCVQRDGMYVSVTLII